MRTRLAVEVVGLDVVGDRGREEAGAGIADAEASAKVGGGDVFVDGGEEVDSVALGWGEGERGELRLGEGKFGAADDDPLGDREQLVGRTPTA